jgi:hypothetical protein
VDLEVDLELSLVFDFLSILNTMKIKRSDGRRTKEEGI